jgi:hypothetical protein
LLYGTDRTALRRTFAEAWRKRRDGLPAEALEARIADIVAAHPEYRRVVEDPGGLERDFEPEQGTNPFLHMAMHLSLREQRASDRPPGIADILSRIQRHLGDVHEAEHAAMECLGRILWEAQRSGTVPDETAYLECLKRLAGGGTR